MAFDKSPSALFPNYSSNGTNITIPLADIEGLTAAEAHTTSGDWRNIFLSICHTALQHYDSLATADKPQAFTADMPTVGRVRTGALAGSLRQVYSFEFYNELPITDVADEPT
jgi:hypothetical protein